MKRRTFAFACVVAVGASCGPVAGPPPPSLPFNSCSDHPCSAYTGAQALTCSGGICVSNNGTFDFTLVVSLPESSFYAPGMTVPIASYTSAVQSSPCAPFAPGTPLNLLAATCLRIPQVVEPSGAMIVEENVVKGVGANGPYIDVSSGVQWSLPVHTQFRPLWPPAGSNASPALVYVEAASIGLPLYPVDAMVIATPGFYPSPRGTPATQWRAPVAPGAYERDIIPENDAFPVVTSSPILASDTSDSTPISGLDVEIGDTAGTARTFTVSRGNGSLAGFTVYLRDSTTLRRVSSLLPLQDDAPSAYVLATVGESPLWSAGEARTLQVVVAPAAGAPIPYLADPIIGTDAIGIAVAGQPFRNVSFPALPPPVAVSGYVTAPDSTPLQASLVIDSVPTTATVTGITTLNPNDPAQKFIHYSTTAATDAQGHYEVTLPPGAYDVFVTPVIGSNAGAASVPLAVGVPLTSAPVAEGKGLQLPPLGTLTGVAILADGRPLAGATVQAQAAVSLAATLDQRRWPRAQTATTDAKGAFAMQVDPGTYDVVVQPADGTGFPWSSVSSQIVTAGKTLALAPTIVPLPQDFDLVLHDPGDNALVRTIVRAFAPAIGATPASPGAPLPVIEIGSGITDASGHLTLLLAPPH
jgi:hypothetical protein